MGTSRTSKGRSRRKSSSYSGNGRLQPADPIVSVYPLPLDAQRAREETQRARRLGKKLPVGHPYRRLPLWMPYWLARLINRSAASSRPVPRVDDDSEGSPGSMSSRSAARI